MKNFIKIFVFLMLTNISIYGQLNEGISIGKNGDTPDPSSILDVVSTNKGVLFPRLDRNSISNPAEGLFVYDIIDKTYYYHNDTGWVSIFSAYTDNVLNSGEINVTTLHFNNRKITGVSSNIDLGNGNSSDDSLSTQLAIKTYVDNAILNSSKDTSGLSTDTVLSKLVSTDVLTVNNSLELGTETITGISTDIGLGGVSASDDSLSTQLSVKTYVDNAIFESQKDTSSLTTDTVLSKLVSTDVLTVNNSLELGTETITGISTDIGLGGVSASDDSLSTQLSVKTYVDNAIFESQKDTSSLTTDTVLSKLVSTDVLTVNNSLELGTETITGISTDIGLGGVSASDDSLSTQLSVKTYVDNAIFDDNQQDNSSFTTDTITSKKSTTDVLTVNNSLELGTETITGISTDIGLGGVSASDDSLSTQLSVKTYVDNAIFESQKDTSSLTTDTVLSKLVSTDVLTVNNSLELGTETITGISTDIGLGGASASNDSLSTQLSVKTYVDNAIFDDNQQDNSSFTTDTITSKKSTTDVLTVNNSLELGTETITGISTDIGLGGVSASDDSLSTQLSVKTYVDNAIFDDNQQDNSSFTTDTITSKKSTTDVLTVNNSLELGTETITGISTDIGLGGVSASDDSLSTQLSVKTYVDNAIFESQKDTSSLTTDTVLSKLVSTDVLTVNNSLELGTETITGISTDIGLGGVSASDDSLSTQLSVKTYVDNAIFDDNQQDNSSFTTDTITSKKSTTDVLTVNNSLELGTETITGISTDIGLGGVSASDDSLSTQLSVKTYVDNAIFESQKDTSSLTTDTVLSKLVSTDVLTVNNSLELGTETITGISTDIGLGGASASNDSLSTQLAIKSYIDSVEPDTLDIAGVLDKGNVANAGQSLLIDSIIGLGTLNFSNNTRKSNLSISDNNFTILSNTDTIARFDYVNNYLHVKGAAYMDSLRITSFASFTTSTFNVPSDKRVKKDIEDIYDGMETIMNLRPVRFKYKDFWAKEHGFKDQYYYSFIAQEFKEIFPDDVFESGLYLKEDKEDKESILNININSAQIVTIKAVQELVIKYKELEQENKNLKANNQNIKDKITHLSRQNNELTVQVEVLIEQYNNIEKLQTDIEFLKQTIAQEKLNISDIR